MSKIIWDQKLIKKYNQTGPRYTSYPTALEFSTDYQENDFVAASKKYPERNLSLYVHIPFCHQICYFCACNKVITRHNSKADIYIDHLALEIAQRAPLFKDRNVTQIHWGGGTPTFLTAAQADRLMQLLKSNFKIDPTAEISIEMDPREIELDMIDHLYASGFNRISMGIQDFNPKVQEAINRVQDEDFIFSLVQRAREVKMNSVNVDLIYGLPYQTKESFRETLEKIVKLNPDRMSVFNYAHIPAKFAGQHKIKDEDLLAPSEKLLILEETISFLTDNGYVYIGMDHFAKPNDELALAQAQGILHRNFQGYTTQADTDLLGFGCSAISLIGDTYAQNFKELKNYYPLIRDNAVALERGIVLTRDDCIRRDVIKELICNFKLDFKMIEELHNIDFNSYFKDDLELLTNLVYDELIAMDSQGIVVLPKGRILIRNICLCFDVYSRRLARQQQFSRII